MLYLIGLGLGDPSDLSIRGLEILKRCDKVFLESYTSLLCDCDGKEALSKLCGKEIITADRDLVEQGTDEILSAAKESDVAFLVVGDPFGATTHTDIILRARERDIPTQVVHNASILNAVGACGLQLYSFGETISIPFWTDTWRPDSFFDKICENKKRGLHTLCLLDIKVKEPNLENMIKGKLTYDPPRFMTTAQASEQLVEIINKNPTSSVISEDDICIGIARVGSSTQLIRTNTLKDMCGIDLGPPLHSLVIPGKLHPLETEFISIFSNVKIESQQK